VLLPKINHEKVGKNLEYKEKFTFSAELENKIP